MTNPATYVISTYSFITTQPVEKLLDVGYRSKDGIPIPSFDENLLIELCSDAKKIFEKENNIIEINDDVIIIGDIHGSLHDLLRILKYIQENDTKVLFLGDYVDRGTFSIECVTILFSLKILKPDKYFFIRGNHEFDTICRQYGFYDEIINYHDRKKINEDVFESHDMDCYRYSENLYQSFLNVFSYLPIAAIVNKTNFCIHGGLSPSLEKVEQIEKEIQRPINDFEENRIFSDIVWSDPSPYFSFFYSNNPRGRGCLFNQNAAFDFLNENKLNRMIRAHECVKDGSASHFHDRCITVFSASSYSKDIENKSGILKLFQKDDSIDLISFEPLQRLEKSEAIYYKVQPMNINNNGKKIQTFFSFRHPQLNSGYQMKKIHQNQGKRIRYHQSLSPQRFVKPLFRSTSKTDNQSVQKSLLFKSVSMDNIDTNNDNFTNLHNESPIAKIRNLSSLDSLPNLEKNDF